MELFSKFLVLPWNFPGKTFLVKMAQKWPFKVTEKEPKVVRTRNSWLLCILVSLIAHKNLKHVKQKLREKLVKICQNRPKSAAKTMIFDADLGLFWHVYTNFSRNSCLTCFKFLWVINVTKTHNNQEFIFLTTFGIFSATLKGHFWAIFTKKVFPEKFQGKTRNLENSSI